MRHHSLLRHGAALAALMSAALLCLPAHAAHALKVCTADGACGHAQAVDDMQMAAVAGKYTIAGEVVGMNLTMASSWQAANGQNLEGKAMLSIALPGSGHAHAHYGTQVSATDPRETTAGAIHSAGPVSTGAGLHSINGVSQVIQIAGDGNGAANRAQVEVTTAPIGTVAGNGQLNASYHAANGAQASAAISGNRVSLQLTMPGAGVVQQQVNAASLGNIQQNIQFAANRQQAMNQLQLQLQIRPPSNALLASSGVGQALNMLRGK
jgi:hypothetical protein